MVTPGTKPGDSDGDSDGQSQVTVMVTVMDKGEMDGTTYFSLAHFRRPCFLISQGT